MAGGTVCKVILIGILGADPELRYTGSGKAVCEIRLATTESWGRGEEREEKTEWHRVVVWDKRAETCAQYLSKGRKVYVEGRLQTRKWQDRDGNDRRTTEIVAKDVVFLSGGGRYDNAGNNHLTNTGRTQGPANNQPAFDDDQIPF